MTKTVFFFSHASQLRWYTMFADALRNQESPIRTILFVHGQVDYEAALATKGYDEVIDVLSEFHYDCTRPFSEQVASKEIQQLEEALNRSIFWESLMTDRWIKHKNNPSFSIQYLNHAFQHVYAAYQKYQPICGIGESTMAIYRLSHYLFDRYQRPFMTPLYCKYSSRFYLETHWDFLWEPMIGLYQQYITKGIPSTLIPIVTKQYEHITALGKPLGIEHFFNKNVRHVRIKSLFNLKKWYAMRKSMRAVPQQEITHNIRYSAHERSLAKKAYNLWKYKRNCHFFNRIAQAKIPDDIQFCVYFLHYQPEYTVDSLGRYYRDQSVLINNIATNLPSNHHLIVKEHPGMLGMREPLFYQDILKNSNVLFAKTTLDSGLLIRQAQIVFTIVGTAALEAMCIGKPAIVFGKHAYTHLNRVYFCADFWQLQPLIRDCLTLTPQPDADIKQYALCLLAAKYEASVPGQLPFTGEQTNDCLYDMNNYQQVKRSFDKHFNELIHNTVK